MSSSSSFSLSFSSSLIPSPHNQDKHKTKKLATAFVTIKPRGQPTNSRVVFRCAASTAWTTSSPANSVEKKKHWKVGEYPGISEVSIPRNGNASGRSKRNPIKNIKKKLDRKNNAQAWANTVTEALSDRIQKKQWLEALEVFEMLKEQPFYQPKEGTYMKLLVLLGKSGRPHRAHQLFETMLEEGLEPTSELYTALLAAYCRSNLIDKVSLF